MLLALVAVIAHAANWPVPAEGPAGPWSTTDKGVSYLDVKVGQGDLAEEGAGLEVHYTGMLEDGTVFDSSLDRGATFSFRIGEHKVIRGWEDGTVGMRVGGVRRLIIPAHLGYGSDGAGPIPPGATLYFEVELLGVDGPRRPPSGPRATAGAAFKGRPGGLQWLDVVTGEGERPKKGERLCIDYTVWHGEQLVEHSFAKERCRWLRWRHDAIPEGLEEGLKTMREGGVRQLRVPAALAYGARGTETVPADADLLFEVELVEVP